MSDTHTTSGAPVSTDQTEGEILDAIRQVAATVRALAQESSDLQELDAPTETQAADQALVIGAASQALANAADLWTGIGVGLAEVRQRVLAGADRTIKVEGES